MAYYAHYFHTNHCMYSLECYCVSILVEYCHLALRLINCVEQLYTHYKEGKDSWTDLRYMCCGLIAVEFWYPELVLHIHQYLF